MPLKDVKINPELIIPLMKTLENVKDEKRLEYIDFLSLEIEQTMEKADHYAKSNNVEYKTALDIIYKKMPITRQFCKNGC